MRAILIATTNGAKRAEFLRYLDVTGISLKTLKDFPGLPEAPEDGKTLEENARRKVLHYATLSKLPTLAVDGGLCIDALDGAPGVKSRRWSGTWTSDEELNGMVMEALKGLPHDKRAARMAITVGFGLPTGEYFAADASIPGYIAETIGPYPKGFPYRGLLLVEPYKKYYSELTKEEHETVNHWRKALDELRPQIISLLGRS